jgi:hypothetical protein
MACHRQGKMQKYRVRHVDATSKVQLNVSGVFREHTVTASKYPYCVPADFDKFVRMAGPGTKSVSGLFLTGHYADDLIRWEKAVPSSRMLVVFHEDFVNNAVGVIDQIQRYLGIPHFNYKSMTYREGNLTFLRGTQSKATGAKRYDSMSPWATQLLNRYYANHTTKLMQHLGLRTPPTNWPTPEP